MSLSDISSQLTKNHLDDFIRQQGGVKHTSWEFAGNSFKKGDSYLSNLFRIIVKGVDDKGYSTFFRLFMVNYEYNIDLCILVKKLKQVW